MNFDLNSMQIRLHPIPLSSGGMAWEAAVSATRLAGPDFVCIPSKTVGGLGDTLAAWLSDAGPHVALQVRIGGLWAPDLIGSEITLAVLGSSPEDARARLVSRSRELAMWLDIHQDGESWQPAEVASSLDMQAVPLRLPQDGRELQRSCPFCHTEDQATERLIEVTRRTLTGLQWTIRSQPHGLDVSRHIHRMRSDLVHRRRRTRLAPEVEQCEVLLARLDAMEAQPEGQPFEVAIAAVALEPIDSLLRFAACEAVSEIGARRCQPGPDLTVPGALGVHAAFRFFNGAEPMGVDHITARALLRWVPGIEELGDDAEADTKKGGPKMIDPRFLFQAS